MGVIGERRAGAQRSQGRVGRGLKGDGARTERGGGFLNHEFHEWTRMDTNGLWREGLGGVLGRGADTEPRGPGRVGRGRDRRTPSWGSALPGACWERAGRRTPCAGRAVMLTAVQSLRLACWERGNPVRGCVVICAITPGIAMRHPGLLTGRPYGTEGWWEVSRDGAMLSGGGRLRRGARDDGR